MHLLSYAEIHISKFIQVHILRFTRLYTFSTTNWDSKFFLVRPEFGTRPKNLVRMRITSKVKIFNFLDDTKPVLFQNSFCAVSTSNSWHLRQNIQRKIIRYLVILNQLNRIVQFWKFKISLVNFIGNYILVRRSFSLYFLYSFYCVVCNYSLLL